MNDKLFELLPVAVIGLVALVETLKVIGEKGVRITPNIMASGGGAGDGGGGIGTLLLLSLFKDRLGLEGAPNGNGAAGNGSKVGSK
jgi:hypothetical protein